MPSFVNSFAFFCLLHYSHYKTDKQFFFLIDGMILSREYFNASLEANADDGKVLAVKLNLKRGGYTFSALIMLVGVKHILGQ